MCFSGKWQCVCVSCFQHTALLCFCCGLPKSEISYGFKQKTVMRQLGRGMHGCWFTASSSSCGDRGVLSIV